MNNFSAKSLLEDITQRDPSFTAVTFYALTKKLSLSYKNLLNEVATIQQHINTTVQRLRPKVLIALDNNPHSVSIYLSLIGLGATVIPINPNTVDNEIENIIRLHKPDLILGHVNVQSHRSELVPLEVIAKAISRQVKNNNEDLELIFDYANEAHLIVHTSGTTGNPKGVELSFSQVIENAKLIAKHIQLDRQNQLTTLPMYHVHAIVFGIFSSLTSHSHLVYTNKFNPVVWLKAIKSEKIIWSSVVPSLLPSLSSMKLGPELSDHLKGIIVSSAPILEEHAVIFEKNTGVPVLQAWGLSEFTCWATCCRSGYQGGEYDGELRSVGHALDDVRVTIRNNQKNLVNEGISGDIYIDGPFKMKGYYEHDSSSTVTAYGIDTGDVGYWKEINGLQYFFISGRKKEIINRAGEKLSPVSIEEIIYKDYPDAFSKIAIVGFNHDVVGEEIGIAISNNYFDNQTSQDGFMEYLNSLHDSIRPRLACCINEDIEMTPTGKIKRGKLLSYFKDYSSLNERFLVAEPVSEN